MQMKVRELDCSNSRTVSFLHKGIEHADDQGCGCENLSQPEFLFAALAQPLQRHRTDGRKGQGNRQSGLRQGIDPQTPEAHLAHVDTQGCHQIQANTLDLLILYQEHQRHRHQADSGEHHHYNNQQIQKCNHK